MTENETTKDQNPKSDRPGENPPEGKVKQSDRDREQKTFQRPGTEVRK